MDIIVKYIIPALLALIVFGGLVVILNAFLVPDGTVALFFKSMMDKVTAIA